MFSVPINFNVKFWNNLCIEIYALYVQNTKCNFPSRLNEEFCFSKNSLFTCTEVQVSIDEMLLVKHFVSTEAYVARYEGLFYDMASR